MIYNSRVDLNTGVDLGDIWRSRLKEIECQPNERNLADNYKIDNW